ncbi:hypothetical protein FBU30_003090 [Linnemannia zychae]|nr:hypothetical protein FBU30_003090 [Linnemannia zychae]
MDISSMAYLSSSSKPVSAPGSTTTTPANTLRTNHSITSTVTSNSHNTASNNTQPPRMASVRVRSSNSVATTASFKSANGASSAIGGRRLDSGSVTSDDGTISEDSDRAGDEMQIFSGGQTCGGINLPFGSNSRQTSSSSSTAAGPTVGLVRSPSTSAVGPKMTGRSSRHRATSSTVGLTNGSGNTMSKPMRMAAGASIKIDPSLSLNNQTTQQSTSLTTTVNGPSIAGSLVGVTPSTPPTSSATLLTWTGTSNPTSLGNSLTRSGSLGHSRSGDEGSGVSIGSGMSASSPQSLQQHGQPTQHSSTLRPVKNSSATTPATIKQAEENRRIEEAARTRRKIADLEISNASLLSINQSLEATIRRQASEVQELKIRMQSAHYGELGYTSADLALSPSVDAFELTDTERQDDLIFKRLCLSIEQMIYEAKIALDQCSKPAGVKVLTLHDMYEKEVQGEERDEDDYNDDMDNIDSREVSRMTFVQDDDNDDNVGIKDSYKKTKYLIEIRSPEDYDKDNNSTNKIPDRAPRQLGQKQQRSRDPSSTRRDSGLSRSSGESPRVSMQQQHRDNIGLFNDYSDDHLDDDSKNTKNGTELGPSNSPHIMISSAVLEAPTILT